MVELRSFSLRINLSYHLSNTMLQTTLLKLSLVLLLSLPTLVKSQCNPNFFITADPNNSILNTECWLGGLMDSLSGWGRNGYYEVPVEPLGVYNWSVTGGTILNGQGTNRIQVRWNELSNSLSFPSNTNISISASSIGCIYSDQYFEITGDPSWAGGGYVLGGPDSVCIGSTEQYTNQWCQYFPCPEYAHYIVQGGNAFISGSNNGQMGGGCLGGFEYLDTLSVQWTSHPGRIWGLDERVCVQCGPIDFKDIVVMGDILGPDPVCTGDTALYYTIGRPSGTFSWGVSGGNILAGQGTDSVWVHWPSTGSGILQLSYNDAFCNSNWSDSITVLPPPAPAAISGPDTICGGMVATYSIPFTPGHDYDWMVSGATILSGQDSSSVVIQGGNSGVIQLEVIEAVGGCSALSVKNVVSSFQVNGINGAQYACPGLPTQLDISTTCTNCAINWTAVGGNILSGQGTDSIAVNWPGSGAQAVSVVVSDGSCTDTLHGSIGLANIVPPPGFGPDTTLCPGESLVLDLGPITFNSAIAFYLWSVSGTFNQTLLVDTAGTYIGTVDYSFPTFNCTYSDTIAVSYSADPNLITDLGPDTTLCPGSNVVLSIPSGMDSVLWSDSSSGSSTTVPAPGSYWVQLIDSAGCEGRDTIQIDTFPNPNVSLGADTLICPGDSILISPGGGFISYNWSTSANTSSIFIGQPGDYWVEITDINGCLGSDTFHLDLLPAAPTANGVVALDSCPVIYFADSSGGVVTSWSWDFGDGIMDTLQDPIHDYTSAGNGIYTVTLITANSCGMDTSVFPITIACIVGINNVLGMDLLVWPNPNQGVFQVRGLLSHPEEVVLEVMDVQGKSVYYRELGLVQERIDERVQLEEISSGTYFLRVFIGGELIEKALVIGLRKD